MPNKKAKAPNVVSELGAKNGYQTGRGYYSSY